MTTNRNWTVLFIGGASGIGKSSLAYELAAAFDNPQMKFIFVHEAEPQQIAQNYVAREGGELQQGRAEVSVAYSDWIADTCKRLGLDVIESRPWSTVLSRATKCLDGV